MTDDEKGKRAKQRTTRRQSPATVARVLDPTERAAKRTATAKSRSDGKAARKADRVKRGGKAEQEHLYKGRSPAQAARGRADKRAADNKASQVKRTKGRDEHLYGGKSESTKARDTAVRKANADKQSQAGRRADGGLHSSAAAKDRKSTKASEVKREGLYDQNSPANRARDRAATKASDDAKNQATRRVGSVEHTADMARKKREAAEKKRKAEEKVKELEAKAKAARERAEKLKGKEKRAARDDAEKLEAEAKAARQETKADSPEQDHLYEGQSSAEKQRDKADSLRAGKQDHLYGADPVAVRREAAARAVSQRQEHLYSARVTESGDAPVSAPPVVVNAAVTMQARCTEQSWSQLNAELALLS